MLIIYSEPGTLLRVAMTLEQPYEKGGSLAPISQMRATEVLRSEGNWCYT